MKKSELFFKCFVGSPERARDLKAALKKKEFCVKSINEEKCAFVQIVADSVAFWQTLEAGSRAFPRLSAPEVSLPEALKLIESVEPDAPEFDIKLRDEVLCRDDISNEWEFCHFSRLGKDRFKVADLASGRKMIKFDGNEHFHGKTNVPDGWWECENGKPIWKTK